jgi:hypothetical protein
MKCWDSNAHVGYPCHEEWVEPGNPRPQAIGLCVRCGEILDLPLVKRLAARGNQRCIEALRAEGIAYLSQSELAADAALGKLTAAERDTLLRRHGKAGA